MKSYKQFVIEISAETDIVTIAHAKQYEKDSEDLRDTASASGRIRGKDENSKRRKRELKQKAKTFRTNAKRHLAAIRNIRKQYKRKTI